MKNEFIIRKANTKDVSDIYQLLKIGTKSGKVLIRKKSEIKLSVDDFYVCCANDKVVGCCSLKIYSEKIAEIRSLVVLPEYQKKGIGSKLVKRCLQKARRNGIYEVLIITEKVSFFNRLGFKESLDDKKPMLLKL